MSISGTERVRSECIDCGKKFMVVPIKLTSREVTPHYCDECAEKIERREYELNLKKRLEILPELYRDITWDNLDIDTHNHEAVAFLRQWAWKPDGLVVLYGDAGRGKTWLAAAVARDMLWNNSPVVFIRMVDLMGRLRSSISNFGENPEKILAMYKSARVLILDDLGTENDNLAQNSNQGVTITWTQEAVFNLVDHRCIHKLPTLITTNLKGQDVSKRYGARVASRLSTAKLFKMEGKDRRKG